MGRNELSVFVYNESKWGDMGRNRLSPLEMGSKGRGEGIQDPQAKEVERQVDRKLNLDSECGSTEEKQDRNTAEGGCATRVWFAQARVPVPQKFPQARASAPHDTLRFRGEMLKLRKTWLPAGPSRKLRSTGLRDTVHSAPFVLR